jgi:hypothetical protein
MNGARSSHGRGKKWITKFLSENLKRRDHTIDPGIDGRVILEWILGK